MKVRVGDIYILDRRRLKFSPLMPDELYLPKIKILFFDDYEFFVDSIGGVDSEFFPATKFKGSRIFARVSRSEIEQYGIYQGFEKINQDFLGFIHCNLPLRMCRLDSLNWDDDIFESADSLHCWLVDHVVSEFFSRKLKINSIYLESTDLKDQWNKPVLITADDSSSIKFPELLWKASAIQGKVPTRQHGIGIYRSGSIGNLPTYYVGGFQDRASILENCNDGVIPMRK